MKEDSKLTTESIQGFVEEIRQIISEARTRAVRSVDFCRVQMYWAIGKRIVLFDVSRDFPHGLWKIFHTVENFDMVALSPAFERNE